jgi:CRISPR-associated protein Csb2
VQFMPDYFRITVQFLDGSFHGRGDGGEPEWPPSPLRLFQALVAAAAAHWNEREQLHHAIPSLRWLEIQPAPTIIAASQAVGAKYRLYVPDNVGDLVAKLWSRGNDGTMAGYRAEKDVRPTRLVGGDAVHYLWPLSPGDKAFAEAREDLVTTARSIIHLGWGIDQVVAEAGVISETEATTLSGERWQAVEESTDTALRAPLKGTLDDLIRKHTAFLGRVTADGFKPVPPLSALRIVNYQNAMQPQKPPVAAFSLLQPDADGYRPYDPARSGMKVAGMMRHAASAKAISTALGWTEEKLQRLVLGHGEGKGDAHVPVEGPRIAFLPLPSLEHRGGKGPVVGSIRRVLVTGLRGCSSEELQQIARLLPGQNLIDEKTEKPAALLSRIPNSEKMVRHYVEPSPTWATVTPVILPGYDDAKKYRQRLFPKEDSGQPLGAEEEKKLLTKLDARTEHLLRKAIVQAGFSEELARNAVLDWRDSGFWPGTDLASRYAVPEKHRRFRRLHARITWRDDQGNPLTIPGPLCLGGGRFIGLGLFAPMPSV